MLETPGERIKLLKAGLPIKTIEMLYIEGNNFRIVPTSSFIELIELDAPHGKRGCISREAAALYA